jgi:probable HAF family extracellular repeat protein
MSNKSGAWRRVRTVGCVAKGWRLSGIVRTNLCVGIFALCTSYTGVSAASFTGLGHLPGGFSSGATAISGDGFTVVGWATSTDARQAFRWTAATGMVGLGDLAGGDLYSDAWGVSADGSVVVGSGTTASGTEAFRWTAQGGMVGLGDLPGGDFGSVARAASADGSVIVGYAETAMGSEAFRWAAATGMVGLGHLPGVGMFGDALGVTPDGAIVVGVSDSSAGTFAFRWTAADGMVSLGDLPGGGVYALPGGVSGDGSVVVGASDDGTFNRAFIWDAAHGMRNLRDVLVTEYGLNVADWTLEGASGISADARTIVGMGINPSGESEAWVAIIPEPSMFLLVLSGAAAGLTRGRRRSGARLWVAQPAGEQGAHESVTAACPRTAAIGRTTRQPGRLLGVIVLAAFLGMVGESRADHLVVYLLQ